MSDEEVCRVETVDGEPVRVHGSDDWDDTDREMFAEVVRAAKRKFAATEHVCTACNVVHDSLTDRSLGMVCGRCNQHTGNYSQGHYWGLCKVLLAEGKPWETAVIDLHFCCPGDCELAPAAEGGDDQ